MLNEQFEFGLQKKSPRQLNYGCVGEVQLIQSSQKLNSSRPFLFAESRRSSR